MALSKEDVPSLIADFRSWLDSDHGRKHILTIENEKREVKELLERLDSMDKDTVEFTDWVLYGLLPYRKTKYAKRVSTFPTFWNIKQLMSYRNYKDKDWNNIARMIYTLVKKFQESPEKLDIWIRQFELNELYRWGFQSGAISPILFCINDSYPVINKRVTRTYEKLAPLYGLEKDMPRTLSDYVEAVNKCKRLIEAIDVAELQNLTIFDLFCYWYDRLYRKSLADEEAMRGAEQQGDEDEDTIEAEPARTDEKVVLSEFLSAFKLDNNVSKFEPHSLRNPERIKIDQIIHYCDSGRWVLPNFQRYFKWEKRQVREFLDSIFKDYYVGALLFWDTKEPELDIMSIQGVDKEKDELRPELIILDGQQRITSLYYAIKAPNFPLYKSLHPLYFYIDFARFFNKPDSDEAITVQNRKLSREESYNRLLFPFYELENYSEWVDGLEDFMLASISSTLNGTAADTGSEKIRQIRRIIDKKLRHIIDGYEIPYIALPETMDIAHVTDIFEKINTAGKALNVFDLLIARLSKDEIDLKDVWEEAGLKYPKIFEYYKRIDKMPNYILQAISLYYHKSSACSREDILNIQRNVINPKELLFEDTWHDMAEFVNAAILKLENLRDGFGVKDKDELPFAPTIPILAALLKEISNRDNKIECNEKLKIWYWASVFSNAYAGAVDTQLTIDFREMREWFDDDKRTPRTVEIARGKVGSSRFHADLVETRSKGSAIYKGVLSLVALEGAHDFNTGQTLENARGNDKHHIFPRSEFQSERFINSILNMTWMSEETNRKLIVDQRPSKYIRSFIEEKYGGNQNTFIKALNSHLINNAAYEHLLQDNFEGFIAERATHIATKIREVLDIQHTPIQEKLTLFSPVTPFTNDLIISNTIKSCREHLYWIDKYFSKEGLVMLRGSLEESKVKQVRILTSVDTVTPLLRDSFKKFKDEMAAAGVIAEMRVMTDSHVKRNIHDRWIISKDNCYNIPSTDTIARGQYSEVKSTSNRPPFEEWWNSSLDIIIKWPEIQKKIDERNNRL